MSIRTPHSSLPPTPAATAAAQQASYFAPRSPSAATSPTGHHHLRSPLASPGVEDPRVSLTAPKDEEIIDIETLQQILELDDDDGSHEFSEGMVNDYFDQAERTFKEMDESLTSENLRELSSKGHFLKGSSAALGLLKVQKSCECIQHYGVLRDEEHGLDLTPQQALEKIASRLKLVKAEYADAKKWLQNYFRNLS